MQQKQGKGTVDVRNVVKAVEGLVAQLKHELEVQAKDSRVKVAEHVLSRLLEFAGPGVSLRWLVEQAIVEYLEARGVDVPDVADLPLNQSISRGERTDPEYRKARRNLARRLFRQNHLCAKCFRVMTRNGTKEQQPKLVDLPDVGATLVCLECESALFGRLQPVRGGA